jgi:GTP-binding protein
MQISVNDGPLAGREGEHVTSRKIRDRLFKEAKTNIALTVGDTDQAGIFAVAARGAMQIAVLVETMRREGYEVCLSRPMAITRKTADGTLEEPYETLWVETPQEYLGGIMNRIVARKGRIEEIKPHNNTTTITAYIPTRGLIGFEFELMNLTSGHGIFSHLFKEYATHCGPMNTRTTGTLVSTEPGEATSYALDTIRERGKLFIAPGDIVYDGMLVGENPRTDDLPVNPTRAKQLTNFRSAGNDKNVMLAPPIRFGLERAIEYIAGDELVEATPKNIRLRKRILDQNLRARETKRMKELAEMQ